MGILYTEKENIILPKEVTLVPYSNEVDYITFSRVLNDTSASYKFYWILGILDEVAKDNYEIDFYRLACRMITYAWFPSENYKLSFGKQDSLKVIIELIKGCEDIIIPKSLKKQEELLKVIYDIKNENIRKEILRLTDLVPYRFLSPFFRKQTSDVERIKREKTGKKSIRLSRVEFNNIIIEESNKTEEVIYSIKRNEENNYIFISEKWRNYLKYNYKILKGWIYYELVVFMQNKNPSVPAVILKLEPPIERDLEKQKKIWKEIISKSIIKDIYTDLELNESHVSDKKISIDHFIPWTFVMHDKAWNLVPTIDRINSSKSDKLVDFENHIEKFCELQYKFFKHIKIKNDKLLEDYEELFKRYDLKEKELAYNEFSEKLKKELKPLYNIALNQGFEYISGVTI